MLAVDDSVLDSTPNGWSNGGQDLHREGSRYGNLGPRSYPRHLPRGIRRLAISFPDPKFASPLMSLAKSSAAQILPDSKL